ncbi:Glycosyltransferase [Acinetobacter baumannii]|uniref:glycosyltransferase family 4 protein n=1 Tax=Acinetobacter baumannii TaxID=470 RepID=UPI000DE66AB8|nr:glycosyltransferase family 4 protein [Acinetobacter baumannii]MDC5058023.1 glycosyltransferase family 4 protein [Acinetobacter baumannii]SSR39537.1 Glycosyltransferase [Acinetobacter baumannii]HCA5044716.1 glycosyltransferase family 4 protein [Acinetobacter baumannii]HCE0437093.1 glycosyltransferase family 4 protein [Acinetobacter baumannii]
MKILYFHQHFSTPKGSAGIRSYAMAQSLIRNGHQVTMVCGSFGAGQTGLTQPFNKGVRRGVVDGIDIIEFELPYSNSLSFLKRILIFLSFAFKSIKVALTEQYDIVFATTTPLTAGIPGIFAKWLRRKPFVFEVRDLWPELPKAMGVIKNPIVLWMMSVLEWTSYHSADRLVGLSPGIVDGIIKRGIAPEKVASIPNGCDLDIFASEHQPWRPAGVKETDLMAIFTGTHGLANGLNAVLDAAVELKARQRTDIKLVLVGDGMQKKALIERAEKLQLDNVVFHDPVNKAKLAGLMASADIGLQILANVPAFYYGTSPNKFFDYISAGLPVLNNYPGWLAELITKEQCGFAVPPENPKAFADALEQAADQREQLNQMGKNGQQVAKEQFNRSILSQKFSDWVTGA